MTDTVQNGKGDQDRTIDFEQYRGAYDEIFRKPKSKGGKDDKSK